MGLLDKLRGGKRRPPEFELGAPRGKPAPFELHDLHGPSHMWVIASILRVRHGQAVLAEHLEKYAIEFNALKQARDEMAALGDQTIRLHMGELSAQEMRAVKAFIGWQASIAARPLSVSDALATVTKHRYIDGDDFAKTGPA